MQLDAYNWLVANAPLSWVPGVALCPPFVLTPLSRCTLLLELGDFHFTTSTCCHSDREAMCGPLVVWQLAAGHLLVLCPIWSAFSMQNISP